MGAFWFSSQIRLKTACAALLSLMVFAAYAEEVVVEGRAIIRDGDIGGARERAMRNALGMAAASGSARISNQTQVGPSGVSESTRLTATACVRKSHVIGESVSGNEVQLSVSVTLDSSANCVEQCQVEHTNKLVVTGIPLAVPEHLEYQESSNIGFMAGEDLARALVKVGRLRVERASNTILYPSPDRAPEVISQSEQGAKGFVELAKKYRSQYVVSGVWRDFSLRPRFIVGEARTMLLDVFIHDGATGALLAHRQFSGNASGSVRTSPKRSFGSQDFYRSDLGLAWQQVLAYAAEWISEKAACLPLIAYVTKVEGKTIYLDAGAESGLANGTKLRLHRTKNESIVTMAGVSLGQEKYAGRDLRIVQVYPAFSVAEFDATSLSPPKVKPGDLLYLQ